TVYEAIAAVVMHHALVVRPSLLSTVPGVAQRRAGRARTRIRCRRRACRARAALQGLHGLRLLRQALSRGDRDRANRYPPQGRDEPPARRLPGQSLIYPLDDAAHGLTSLVWLCLTAAYTSTLDDSTAGAASLAAITAACAPPTSARSSSPSVTLP